MKLILDTENSSPTTITVKGKEIILILIESSIFIDSTQIAKIFDKKEKTVHGIEAPFVWQILTNEAKLPNIISEVNDIDVYVEFILILFIL